MDGDRDLTPELGNKEEDAVDLSVPGGGLEDPLPAV